MFYLNINEDIHLNLLTPKYDEDLLNLIKNNKEHLSKWLPWVGNFNSIEDAHNFTFQNKESYKSEGISKFALGIFYKEELAGTIGINSIDLNNRSCILGYWLGKEYIQKGIMTLAAKGFIKYLFEDYKLNRIEIRVATGNYASQNVAKRLEFTLEGTLREAENLDGRFVDHNVYSLLVHEFE